MDQPEQNLDSQNEPQSHEDKLSGLEEMLQQKQNDYLRLLAELDNLRKRNQKEKIEYIRYAQEPVLKDLLPILDSFEKVSFNDDSNDEGLKSTISGILMIVKQFKEILIKHGLEPIHAEKMPFDPNFHQAIQRIEADNEVIPVETVHQEFIKGYKLFDRLLRPAMVSVLVPTSPTDM